MRSDVKPGCTPGMWHGLGWALLLCLPFYVLIGVLFWLAWEWA